MQNDVPALLESAQDGDDDAALQIWDTYYERLVRYARHRMKGMALRATDEEDVALSALNSFFGGVRDGKLAPKDANELWKLLATITVRKATAQLRQHHAAKRGGGKVRGDSAFDQNQVRGESSFAGCDMDSISPHLGVASEELLAKLRDPDLQRLALLRLSNYTNEEIAQQLDCSVATVKRKVAAIRGLWAAELN